MTRNAHFALAAILLLAIGLPFAALAGAATDTDNDGVPDVLDKCTLDSRNATAPSTCDTDRDGYGNVCDPDYDQNGTVNAVDFSDYFIPAFKGGSAARGQDMDCNSSFNSNDFSGYFVPKFKGMMGGAIPGPSGLACAGTPGCS
jgi:hypothetical protein